MNYEVPIKQSKRPESEDSMVEIKKKQWDMQNGSVVILWRGKKEKGDRKWK